MKIKFNTFLCYSVAFFLVLYSTVVQAEKILIMTYSYNRPDFIEWQHKAFEKFLLDDYEFVIFNDASNADISHQIEAMCNKYNIMCMRVPQNHSNNTAGARHQDAIQFSLNTVGFKYDGIVCMFDSDMFLVKPFSIINLMKDYDIAAGAQSRPNVDFYLDPTIVFMDMRRLPNKETMDWHGGILNGSPCDTGGRMYYYLKSNPGIRHYQTGHVYFDYSPTAVGEAGLICAQCKRAQNLACKHNTEVLKNCGLDCHAIKFMQAGVLGGTEFYLDSHFLHYRGASWDFSNNQSKKTSRVSQYMNELLGL